MGHIYRSLSLAETLHDSEIFFMTDVCSDLAMSHLSELPGWIGAFPEESILSTILHIGPDMVVFDVLDTDKEMICELKRTGIKVISFEDLGTGSAYTDLTINELFDEAEFDGDHYRWGRDYFFVRDEFANRTPKSLSERVNCVLLTFGGTDQHNLSRKVYEKIGKYCAGRQIEINIVTGPGYTEVASLTRLVEGIKGVTLVHATGVISEVMAKSDLAITSNGRTVYELAHMNVPGLVVNQHPRESTHDFARPENGYINLGLYRPVETEEKILATFCSVVETFDLYQRLYDSVVPHNFSKARSKGIGEITALLDSIEKT